MSTEFASRLEPMSIDGCATVLKRIARDLKAEANVSLNHGQPIEEWARETAARIFGEENVE